MDGLTEHQKTALFQALYCRRRGLAGYMPRTIADHSVCRSLAKRERGLLVSIGTVADVDDHNREGIGYALTKEGFRLAKVLFADEPEASWESDVRAAAGRHRPRSHRR